MTTSRSYPYGRRLPQEDGRRFLRVLADPWYRGLAQLQSSVTESTTDFWRSRGVKALHLPITTSAVSSPIGLGSDSLPVEVDLFGVRTHLADSMQFALEYGCRLCRSGAWYLMPSFRGEPADSTHLCQFFHSEAEVPIDLAGCIELADMYVRALCEGLLSTAAAEIVAMAGTVKHIQTLLDDGFARMTFDEAWDELAPDPRFVDASNAGWRNIRRAGELELIRRAGRGVWVTHWDRLAVPFYQAYDDIDPGKAKNADLLLGIGEVVGLGERHRTGNDVRRALEFHEVDPAPYGWYVAMHDELPVTTSGFGMGVERFLAWVVSHDDVRDLQILPRHNGMELVP